MGYGHTGGRVQNQISRQVRNAARRLHELEREQVGEPPEPLRFRPTALASGPPDGILLSLRDAQVPGRLRLDRLDVPATARLLVTGANGAGKSTLLAVMAGQLAASGEVRRRRGLTVGLLTQDTVFDEPDRSAREIYERALGAERADSVPLHSLGLIGPHDLARPRRGTVGRPAPPARPGAARGEPAAVAPPGRAHQPSLTPTLRRTGGRPGHRPRCHRVRQPRPVAARPPAGPRDPPARAHVSLSRRGAGRLVAGRGESKAGDQLLGDGAGARWRCPPRRYNLHRTFRYV
jgi:energy-coupling factor transporter ATP-binding protein EcfA2